MKETARKVPAKGPGSIALGGHLRHAYRAHVTILQTQEEFLGALAMAEEGGTGHGWGDEAAVVGRITSAVQC